MRKLHSEVAEPVGLAVSKLFYQFGLWAVLLALLKAVLAERRKTNDLAQLSDRMLKDIGASVDEDHLHPRKFSLWDIRF